MKKYRYGEAGTGLFSTIRKYNLFYFVMAWNVFGYGIYKYATSDKPENWKKMDSTRRYVSLMGHSDQQMKIIKVTSTGITSETESVEDFVTPDPPAPPTNY